ncbi:MAG: Peptidyl-prolyl cis-trans isomerase [uncultured Sphingosinicella sp.]|uniref:Peptidyl-prolyl cis-trans isomerase n=1 Tax=uncultured Sphingosinicella sp. TaxID=478748 RepID=A0A6J4U2K6_9SPHN|nr:peptidylprolyl isomerase [uncultured Sphingosinicella sp.]CAA9537705.1 MAG: Peptidyl-prolyl cis-trans isomerase [uncultured Sphingosinicella sp.]
MRLKSLFALGAGALLASSVGAQTTQATPAEPATPVVKTAPLEVPALDPENTLHLDLSTGGRVSIQLRPDVAPAHVERIKTLARQGFYNGVVFHRVIEGFMAQTGDPTATGTGGSPLPDLAAEFNTLPHVRGAVSAARAGEPNSANSQFFIVFSPRFSLDSKYSVFGRVVSGMQYVDAIERGEPPASPSRVLRASIGADNVAPPGPAEVAAMMQRQSAPVAASIGTAPAGTAPTQQ